MKIKVSLWLLCGVQHSVIMANFMMPETHQLIIVIILIIYLLKNLVELKEYISGRIASYLFQFLRKLHSFLSAGICRAWSRVLFAPRPLIDRAPREWCNFLNYVYNAYLRRWHKNIIYMWPSMRKPGFGDKI